jgi:glucosamine 6-phosphate synthetase-like amidotransferase/phosphosugar isomerase protein
MMQAGDIFEHAMLREIYEQPRALADTIERYAPNGKLATDVFQPVADALRGRERMVIAASGSSRHAGLAAEIMLERGLLVIASVGKPRDLASRNPASVSAVSPD